MAAPQVGQASAVCAQSMHSERSPQGSSLTSDEEPGPPQGQKRRAWSRAAGSRPLLLPPATPPLLSSLLPFPPPGF